MYLGKIKELGIRIVSESGENIVAFCPFHDDKEKPSFSFNTTNGLYKCFVASCPAFQGGNFAKLYQFKTGKTYDLPPIPESILKDLSIKLVSNPKVVKWLSDKRGLTADTITRFRLGYEDGRLQIPIFKDGHCVNIRRHAIERGLKPKTLNIPGRGKMRLFPEEALKEKEIIICEGELDAMLAIQLGFNALTVSTGAGLWNDEFTPLFAGKDVVVLYDIDAAGYGGAIEICEKLKPVTHTLRNVRLPITSPSNGDLTDYIIEHGNSAEDLRDLIDSTPYYIAQEEIKKIEIAGPIFDVELAQAAQNELVGKHIRVRAMVSGKDTQPYVIPKIVRFECPGGLPICTKCSLPKAKGIISFEMPTDSVGILKCLEVTDDQQRTQIRRMSGVHPTCSKPKISTEKFTTVENIWLIPEVSFSAEANSEYVIRQGYYIGEGIKSNAIYEFEGTPVPHPKNQSVSFIFWKATPVQDSLANYEIDDKTKEELKIFQPTYGQSVPEKMKEIATDLSVNVTKIFQREDLVQTIDLVFHSVLQFKFQDVLLKKGWSECLIIGDTRCGKTETITNLVNHYKAGELSTGENCSYAGLIGGVQQVANKKWSISWGKIPLNDKRLFVIDEVSGMDVEDIGSMSSVRSSGVAEITKIQSEKTHARTRLIWMANPRSSRSLATYDYGVLAVKELIGRPEDIARFDLILSVATNEVPIDIINRGSNGACSNKYTSHLCNRLISWVWSRKASHVKITDEATKLCLELSKQQGATFHSTIPIVQIEEQRVKLIRLATACAARLFSTEDGEILLVKPEHVQYAFDFMDTAYSKRSLGYRQYSESRFSEETLREKHLLDLLIKNHGKHFVDFLLRSTVFREIDIEQILNVDMKEVRAIFITLVRSNAIRRTQYGYVKQPPFIVYLREQTAPVAVSAQEDY